MKFGARELLFLLVMLGLLGSAWFFVFKKADERIATLNADTQTKQRRLQELREASERIEDINKKIDELQQQIRFFESRLPRERETGGIVSSVHKEASSRKLLAVDKITALKPEKAAGYYELPVKILIKGDFRSFYQFMLNIEQMDRITRVNQMKLTKINEQDGSMTADMTLSIYFAPEK